MSLDDDDEDLNEESGSVRKLSDADFATARELYELGKATLAQLADDFGVTRQTLSRNFKDVGAVKGSRAQEVAGSKKPIPERFSEKRTEWIEETRLEGVKALKQARMLGQKMVTDIVRKSIAAGKGVELALIDDDLKALGRFNKVLVDNIEATLRVLKSDEHIDEDDLPTLTIEDLTDDDILRHHISTGALEEDATLEDINNFAGNGDDL